MKENISVLVVDDDPNLLWATARIVSKIGFSVLKAANGEEALEMTRIHRPDMILLDVDMPDISGLDVCRKIKSDDELKSTFIVLLSATRISSEDQTAGLDYGGADGYITRPISNKELAARISAKVRIIKAERALRASEQKFRLLYQSSPLAYQSLDENGRIIEVNDAWTHLLGYSRNEAIGKKFEALLVGTQKDRFRRIFADCKISQTLKTETLELNRKDGHHIIAEVDGKTATDPSGENLLIHCILRDVTESKRLAKERQALNRHILQMQKMESLGLMAGSMAHDFNNLLQIIIGNADMALFECEENDKLKKLITRIIQSAKKANKITKSMLAYAGQGQTSTIEINLTEFINEIRKTIEISAPGHIAFEFDLKEDIGKIIADPLQIRQVIMNLVKNAVEAIGDKKGKIRIRTASAYYQSNALPGKYIHENVQDGRYVKLELSDNGRGISEENLPKIFDPFFTTGFFGRGLGLAAVMGIVRSNQGFIDVASKAGKGSRFMILLPVADSSGQTEKE